LKRFWNFCLTDTRSCWSIACWILEGRFLRAVKNVSVTAVFPGHFPGKPILPGVLILEAMAQATGILAFKSVENWNRASCILPASTRFLQTSGSTWRSDDYGSHFENPPRPDSVSKALRR
jgi:hypothetical protein